jgi:3-oxoisoapionate decarboxylase
VKLGLSSYALPWAIADATRRVSWAGTAESLVRRAAGLGLHVVQIADNLPLGALSRTDRDSLRHLADSLRVEIEVGARGLAREHAAASIGIARDMGSRILRFVADGESYLPSTSELALVITGLLPGLEAAGITLVLENHDRFSCRELAALIGSFHSPRVGICLDTVNSFGAQEGPDVVIDVLGPLAANLHLKDFRIFRPVHNMGFTVEGTPAGQGVLKIPDLLARVGAFGRDPNALLELWVPPEQTPEETLEKERRWLEESVGYLRTLITD